MREYKLQRRYVIPECYNIYPFSVLRNSEILTVQNLIKHRISQFFQNISNHLKCTPSIMVDKVFDILTKYNFRFMFLYNPCNIKKQCPSRILEPSFMSCKRKRLTRKACEQYIVIRNIFFINFCNISDYINTVIKICFISFYRFFIPFADKNGLDIFSECLVKSKPDPSDTSKQIN